MTHAMASMPKYENYKDSGYPWLENVPAEWRLERGKWHLHKKKELNSKGQEQNVLSLTLRGVVNNDPDNPEGLVPKDYRTYQMFEKEDLVFKLIDLENVRTSRVGLVHENGIMSSAYIRIAHDDNWNARFLYYFYYHLYQAEVFNKIGSGVRSTLGASDLLDLPIPIISKNLQDKIVIFLDEKTVQIDEAIGIKERQIALLKERKQIIIQNAVIKGLNPSAPMKDSGVDWIGDIPSHWEIVRSKRLFMERKTKAPKGSKQLTASQKYGMIYQDEYMELEGRRVTQVMLNYNILKEVKAGDFVISMRSFQGGLEYSPYLGAASSAYLPIYPSREIADDYYKYLFKSSRYIEALSSTSNLVRDGQALRFDNFEMVDLLYPPLKEQREIAQFISDTIDAMAKVEENFYNQIDKLKEYKASLINSAVTGKIKVI